MVKRFFGKMFKFIGRTMDDNLGLYAAQASFFIIFSVTPFIMLLITLAKYFIPIDVSQILTEVYRHVPQALASFVSDMLMDVFDSSVGIISVTAVSTLWLASKGIMALYLGLNNVFKPENPLNYFYARFISIIYTIVFIFAMLLTILVFGFGSSISRLFEGRIEFIITVINKVLEFRVVLFMAALTFIFASFYKFLPRTNNTFRRQLPGAALSAVGWLVFSYIYSIYIERFSNYSYVYGSLAAIIFLMLWLYVCMSIFLYGAEFNKLRDEGFFDNADKTPPTEVGKK